jgi:hypothetical protein
MRTGAENAECRQELIDIYQTEIANFNASHQIMQAELLVSDWTDNASDKLFEK